MKIFGQQVIVAGLIATLSIACANNKEEKAEHADEALTFERLEIKRFPLPTKKESHFNKENLTAAEYVREVNRLDSLIQKIRLDTLPIEEKERRMYEIRGRIGELKELAAIEKYESMCGKYDETVDVERYAMKSGIPTAFVMSKAVPVGLIKWNDDLHKYFQGAKDDDGRLAGHCWGSGCLVGEDTFITAGHCFDSMVNDTKTPRKNGVILSGWAFAKYMHVTFNYQKSGNSENIRPDSMSFPILSLIEYREGGLDYAIVKLGKSKTGKVAGKEFGTISMASRQYKNQLGDTLLVIQHPDGKPKRVGYGPLVYSDGNYLYYDKIDTKDISSGAPVINFQSGLLIGIHVLGGCDDKEGSNSAVKVQAIRNKSKILL